MPLPLALAGFAAKPFIAPIVGFFRSITAKQWLYFLVTVFMAIMVYRGYNWIYDRGAASRQPEIDQIAGELKTERQRIADWQAASTASQKTFATAQTALKKELAAALELANNQAGQREVVIREIPKYITKADDAACRIPVNVGLVHNATIEGQDAARRDGLSGTTPGVQGKASTLTLSEYARINGKNNSEAVRRGRMIRQWEEWYDRTAAQWKQSQKESIDRIYKQNPPPTARLNDVPADTAVTVDQPIEVNQPKPELVLESLPVPEPMLIQANLESANSPTFYSETGWHEAAATCTIDQAEDCNQLVVPADSHLGQEADSPRVDHERFSTWRVAA